MSPTLQIPWLYWLALLLEYVCGRMKGYVWTLLWTGQRMSLEQRLHFYIHDGRTQQSEHI
jgi:hypothetical protein